MLKLPEVETASATWLHATSQLETLRDDRENFFLPKDYMVVISP